GVARHRCPGRLASRLASPVAVVNDVHAIALAEARVGAGVGADRVLAIAVGTGIGGGVVRHGMLDAGAHGVAGSFGHMSVAAAAGVRCTCGGIGHAEAVASGPALERRYAEIVGHECGLREIVQRSRQGDATARSLITFGAEVLGEVVANAAAA